jgi:hypothetical protein
MFGPNIGAKPHPLLASPVEGEVPFGGCGEIVPYSGSRYPDPSHPLARQ